MSNPFCFNENASERFIAEMNEVSQVHYNGNALFRRLWEREGLKPGFLKDEKDLERLPFLPVGIFKEMELVTGPREKIVMELTSSGTGGQKSRIFLDRVSLERVELIARDVYNALGMVCPEESGNYLCFTYDPAIASDLGTAWTDKLLTGFTKKNEVYYAIQWDKAKGAFELNREGVWKKLLEFSAQALPVRILGFPAMIYEVMIRRAEAEDVRLKLGDKSWVMTGGGWKGASDVELPKADFKRRLSGVLGLPERNIRDLFGMVEHGVPYVDCEFGNMHIPNYSRVIIRDPATLSPLGYGEKGLIQFITAYLTSYPSISLLTTDWGIVRKDCPCGRGPVLEVKGRAGVTKHKGCAVKAAELL